MKAAAIVVLILVSSSWFYLRNLRLTGTITGGHPDWAAEHLNAVRVPVGELATHAETWQRLASLFVPIPALGGFGLLLIGVPMAGGLAAAGAAIARGRAAREDAAVACLLAVEAALIVAMQLKYSAGGGGLHPRYLLPALVALAVVMGTGMTRPQCSAGIVTGVWFAAWATLFVPWWWRLAARDAPTGAGLPAWPVAATTLLGVALAAWALAVILIGRSGLRATV